MDLIQTNGQPRFGRFSIVPSMINIDRYEYRTEKGQSVTGWRKRLKYKKYKFCSIQHEDYIIGLTIADVSWAGYGAFYIYNYKTQETLHWSALNLLSRKTRLDEQPLFNHSYFHNSPFQIQVEHANGARYIQLTKFGEIQLSARIFCVGTQPLSLCKPNGENGWIYTQQLMTLNCEGFFIDKSGEIIQFQDHTFVSLNDTCGFLKSDTNWRRLSSSFLVDQHRIGFNLRLNDMDEQHNENCLWVNRQLYTLSDVHIEQLDSAQWHIYSLDHSIDIKVMLQGRHSEHLNLRWVNHQLEHWTAKISGKIKYNDQEILFENEKGIFEKQEAKI
jgi:hypothetical protein